MIIRKEIRSEALKTLKGKWTNPVLATLIFAMIYGGLTESSIIFQKLNLSSVIANSGNATRILAFIFIGLNIAFGYYVSFLRFNKGRESNVKEMFSAAFSENYRRNLGIMLLTCMYIILWSLLLVIPGIVKAYSYAMTPYIAEEHPELSAEECIKKSMIMMSGHKMDLFLLQLSFIGWILLSFLTFGIGLLWVAPWMQMADVKFYEKIKFKNAENTVG